MDIEAPGNQTQDDQILYAGESSSYEDHSQKSLLNSPNLRVQFVRKVYSILSLQLCFTALISYFSMTNASIASFQLNSPATLVLSIIVSIVVLIAMVCSKNLTRTVPTNYILLSLFTLCESYTVSFICAAFSWTEDFQPFQEGREIVALAALLTIGVTLALTVYAFTTKSDFTILSGFLFIMIAVLMLSSLLFIFYSFQAFEMICCSLSAITYGIYIIYDTQIIMGGKRYSLEIDDYILGALFLYIDIIRLFLRLLELIAKSKKK